MEKLTIENAQLGQRILVHNIGVPGYRPDFVGVVEKINKVSIQLLDYGTFRKNKDYWHDRYHNYYDIFILTEEEYQEFLKGTLCTQIEYLIDKSEGLLHILKEMENIVSSSDYLKLNDKKLKDDFKDIIHDLDGMITSYNNLKEKEVKEE